MPRTLTGAFKSGMLNPERTVYGVVFAALTHPKMTGIYVVNDFTHVNASTQRPVPYSYASKSWTAYPFDLPIFSDTKEVPQTRLRIQNVDRRIGNTLMAISDPIKVAITVLSSADFVLNGSGTSMDPIGAPAVQYSAPLAYLRNVRWDRNDVTGELRPFDPSREPYPFIRGTPEVAPGLWL